MRMRSTIKISLTALLALLLVLALVALLNVFRFQGTLAQIAATRVEVIVDDVQQSIEAALDLGLSLGDMAATSDILARAQSRDARILTVAVFGGDGRVLFAAGDSPPETVATWRDALGRAGADGRWSLVGPDSTVFGRRLDSSYATGVGGIAVIYSTAAEAARVAEVRDGIIHMSVLVFLGFGLLAVIVTIMALSDLRRLVRAVLHGLQGERDEALPGDLAGEIRGFRRKVAEAEAEIDAVEALAPDAASRARPVVEA